MTWIFVILVVVFYFSLRSNSRSKRISTTSQKTTVKSRPIGIFEREHVYFNVRGIWAHKSNIRAFRRLEVGQILNLVFEYDNKYDKNALGVENSDGQMLGYIPRNRRKLLKTLRRYPETIVQVNELDEFYSERKNRQIYRLQVKIWVGFTSQELESELNELQFKEDVRGEYSSILRDRKEIQEKIKQVKKKDPVKALSLLDEISVRIMKHNLNAEFIGYTNWIERPLLEELTVITNSQKMYEKTIVFFDKFGEKNLYTDRQFDKILKRVDKAKKMIVKSKI